jgi:hypothetical protein
MLSITWKTLIPVVPLCLLLSFARPASGQG